MNAAGAWEFMEIKGKKVAVVGLGKSGLAAALFLRRRGAQVTVSDVRSAEELAKEIPALIEEGIAVEAGGHGLLAFRRQDLIVVSPGVPVDTPELVVAPGMTAYVNITVAQRKDALLVPNAALRFHPAKTVSQKDGMRKREARQDDGQGGGTAGTVYVLENGQLNPVRVVIGITHNRMSEVMGNGLKPGNEVVVSDIQATEASNTHRGMRLF